MLITSETQKVKPNIDFPVQWNLGTNSEFGKEKLQNYLEKLKLPKTKRPIGKSSCQKEETHNGNVDKKFKEIVLESYICQICHQCLYKRSVQYFEFSNPLTVLSFHGCFVYS